MWGVGRQTKCKWLGFQQPVIQLADWSSPLLDPCMATIAGSFPGYQAAPARLTAASARGFLFEAARLHREPACCAVIAQGLSACRKGCGVGAREPNHTV